MKRFVILSMIITLLFSGCHKKQNIYIDYNPVIKSSNDYTNVQQLTVRLLQTFFKVTVDSSIILNGYNPNIDGAACTYYHDTVTDSVFYRIKYGNWGVIDPYGKRRGGEIYVNLDGDIHDSLTSGEFVFKHFHYEFDSLSAENLLIVNNGFDETHNLLFDISAGKMKWNTDSVHSVVWSFQQTYRQNNNESFSIWGQFSGTAQSGINFQVTNDKETAIIASGDCAWIKNGQMEFSWGNQENRAQILFPDSTSCQNVYHLIINDLRFDKAIE